MSFDTIQQLTQKVILEIGLVPGTNVQIYAEDSIEQAIRTCYESLFTKVFWPHLTVTTEHQLDGETGVITDELSNIEREGDIEWIRQYPFAPQDIIHKVVDGDTDHPYNQRWEMLPYISPQYNEKKINFYPKDLNTSVRVRARRKVDIAGSSAVIPLDAIMIVHYVAAHMFATDGLYPNAEARHTALFEQRFLDLISTQSTGVSRYNINRIETETFTVAGM